MKFIALGALALAAHSSLAFAEQPLLVRVTSPGFVPPGYGVQTDCTVWKNKVVRKVISGEVLVTQERPTTISLESMKKTIAAAKKGTLDKKIAPVDGPGVTDWAVIAAPNDGYELVTLLKNNGGDGEIVTNQSAEAHGLRLLLDELCK